MSLRDELREVFNDLSEPAHPALSARIRDQITTRPPVSSRPPRLASAVAVLIAVAVVAGLVYAGRHVIPNPAPAGQPTPAPAVSAPGPTALPAASGPEPTASPTSGPATLPAFSCRALSAGTAGSVSPAVTAARAGAQSGYDRFVLELDGPVQHYQVTPVASATFVQDPKGSTVTLAGSAGLIVQVRDAQVPATFAGSTDLKPGGTAVLKEARLVGSFEGVVTWGLGLSHANCFRAFTLTGPSRLVVDVQS